MHQNHAQARVGPPVAKGVAGGTTLGSCSEDSVLAVRIGSKQAAGGEREREREGLGVEEVRENW